MDAHTYDDATTKHLQQHTAVVFRLLFGSVSGLICQKKTIFNYTNYMSI